jgi:flagellar basal body rod protein FlgC
MDTNVSLSGTNAAAQNALVTANNVANLRSENSQARRPDQAEQANDSVRPTQVQASQEPPPQDRERSNVQSERDMVRDETAYSANATVVGTQNQMMMGAVMDLRA